MQLFGAFQKSQKFLDEALLTWKICRSLSVANITTLTNPDQWNYVEAQVFLAQMRNEIRDLKIHAYLDVSIVYGQKPGGPMG